MSSVILHARMSILFDFGKSHQGPSVELLQVLVMRRSGN